VNRKGRDAFSESVSEPPSFVMNRFFLNPTNQSRKKLLHNKGKGFTLRKLLSTVL